MDYLLDEYIFKYLPFSVSEETKRNIVSKSVDLLRAADWMCKAQDIRKLVTNHTSLLAAEALFLILFLCTFVHAFRHGRRYIFTWLGIAFIGGLAECLRFVNPAWDVVWHAQGTLTYCGMRIPWYLCGVYQTINYVSYVFARRLYLRWWAEGPAAGLIAAMLYFPLNLFGVKLLWFQWHGSDVAVYDKWHWIPWTAQLFPALVACSFVWLLHLLRRVLLPQLYDWKLFIREYFCASVAGISCVAVAAVQMEVLVQLLRNMLKINMSIPTVGILAFYALLFFIGDRHNNRSEARPRGERRYWFDELACAVCVYFLFFSLLPLVTDPQNIASEGLHQPLGPCNISDVYQNFLGSAFKRQKYLCPYEHYDGYYDFHCLPDRRPPPLQEDSESLEWYVICGTDFDNRLEYIVIAWFSSLISLAILYQIGARSGLTPIDYIKIYGRRGASSFVRRAPAPRRVYAEEQGPEDFEEVPQPELYAEKKERIPTASETASESSSLRQRRKQPQDVNEPENEDAEVAGTSKETPAKLRSSKLTRSNSGSRAKKETAPAPDYSEPPRTLRSARKPVT